MKRFLMITTASALLCGQAFAQQAAVMPTPSLSATSPLGMVPSAPVGGTGIPFGATEITSPGVSPTPIPSTGIIGSTVCSTIGTAPSTMFGSASSFDGGGMAVGTVTPQSTMAMLVVGHFADIGPDRHVGYPKHVRRRLGQVLPRHRRRRLRRRRAACRAPAFRWARPRSAISGSAPPRRCRPSPSRPPSLCNDPDGARRHASGPEHDDRPRGHRSHHGDTEHLRDAEHGTGPVTRRHDVALSGNPTRETQP